MTNNAQQAGRSLTRANAQGFPILRPSGAPEHAPRHPNPQATPTG
jgi:hypothetical protein